MPLISIKPIANTSTFHYGSIKIKYNVFADENGVYLHSTMVPLKSLLVAVLI